jgi:hypothetical protein
LPHATGAGVAGGGAGGVPPPPPHFALKWRPAVFAVKPWQCTGGLPAAELMSSVAATTIMAMCVFIDVGRR